MSAKKSAKKSGSVSDGRVATNAAMHARTTTAAPASVKVAAVVAAPLAAKPQASSPSVVATALIQALRDPSAETAREAALSLGKLGEVSAVAPLVEVIANVDGYFHSIVRAAACAGLGQLGDRGATPALLTAVSDPVAEASAEAVRALASLGDERAVEPLADVVRNERGFFLPFVRLAAVTALRQFKAPEAAAALKAVAANDAEDPALRAAAA